MADVIKEFLVGLGFAVDDQQQRKFSGAITAAEKNVAAMAAAATAAGVAVVAAVEKFARSGDRIYWLGQRAGASASGIENMAYAASQLGSSAESAYGSIESFGRFLQSSPGAKQFVERWTGPFETAEDALVKFGRAMKDKPAYFRNAVASQLGLDYNFAQSLFSGDFEKRIKEREDRKVKIGFDEDQYTAEMEKFQDKWRILLDQINIVTEKTVVKISPMVMKAMGEVQGYLEEHGSDVADFLAKHSVDFSSAIGGFTSGVRGLAEAATDALEGDFSKAFSEAIDTGKRFWESFLDRDPLVSPLLKGLQSISDFLHEPWEQAWAQARGVAERALSWISGTVPGFLKELIGIKEAHAEEVPAYSDQGGDRRKQSGASGGWGEMPGDIGSDAESGIKHFMAKGWTREQAAGIIANLTAESQRNPHAVGDNGQAVGVAQWHPDRQANFARVFGKSLSGASRREQYDFVDWELRNTESAAGNRLRAAKTARLAGEIVSSGYERPLARNEAMRSRGDLAEKFMLSSQMMAQRQPANVSQTNNVTINGATDPEATAKAVGKTLQSHGGWLRDVAGPAW